MMLATIDANGWAAIIGAFFTGLASLAVAIAGLRKGQQTANILTNGHDQMVASQAVMAKQLKDAGIPVNPPIPPLLNSPSIPTPPAQ